MIVSIITYSFNHLKTEQIVLGLSTRKDLMLKLICLPFKQRAERNVLFSHRPDMKKGIHPLDLARFLNLECFSVEDPEKFIYPDSDYILIGGCGILPPSLIRDKKIINCHPGLIPTVRGLDAFKWAILNQHPLGNSLHYIDSNVDSGEHIFSCLTPVMKEDYLEELAQRHYNLEISMILNFLNLVAQKHDPSPEFLETEPNRRMSFEKETEMLDVFKFYKEKYSIN